MADLPSSEQIGALNETLKIGLGGLASLIAGAGTLYTFLSNRNKNTADTNTKVTQINTAALSQHAHDMDAMKNNAKAEIAVLKGQISEMQSDLAESVRQIKIAAGKLHSEATDGLSMIPKIQDALEAQQREIEAEKLRKDEILRIINKGKP